jgi:hypothetical protein
MNKVNLIATVVLLACTLTSANTPPTCTANLTATSYNVNQYQLINITVRSNNIPGILVNYDVKLYADDKTTPIRTVNNVACYLIVGDYGYFEYTFVNVNVTKLGVTNYTAVIYKSFLLIFLVEVKSHYIFVDAGRTTSLAKLRLDQNNIDYTLYNTLTINGPPLTSQDPIPTGTINCHTLIVNTSETRDTDTGGLAPNLDGTYGGACDIGQVLPGYLVQTHVSYPGDSNYSPSSYDLEFVGTDANFARAASAPLAAQDASSAPLAAEGAPKKNKKVATRNTNYLL